MNFFTDLAGYDPVEIASILIRYPSVTPHDADCLKELAQFLQDKECDATLRVYGDTTNLYAVYGKGKKTICFAGHTDVVPPGRTEAWKFDPFTPTIHDGCLYGRGVSDMKGAVACFLAAFLELRKDFPSLFNRGKCAILLTSDEEGVGVNGIPAMIPWMYEHQNVPDVFLIGEPTGNVVGEVLQTGRRGSVTVQAHIVADDVCQKVCALMQTMQGDWDKGNTEFEPSRLEITALDTYTLPTENIVPSDDLFSVVEIIIKGKQGHIAYPDMACNPLPVLVNFLASLKDTSCRILSVETNNPIVNIIPEYTRATLAIPYENRGLIEKMVAPYKTEGIEIKYNMSETIKTLCMAKRITLQCGIRFNPLQTAEKLIEAVQRRFDCLGENTEKVDLVMRHSGDPFITRDEPWIQCVTEAILKETGCTPPHTTRGGTTDGRFLCHMAPVIEVGLSQKTMHQIDEHVQIEEMYALTRIYRNIIIDYFSESSDDSENTLQTS